LGLYLLFGGGVLTFTVSLYAATAEESPLNKIGPIVAALLPAAGAAWLCKIAVVTKGWHRLLVAGLALAVTATSLWMSYRLPLASDWWLFAAGLFSAMAIAVLVDHVYEQASPTKSEPGRPADQGDSVHVPVVPAKPTVHGSRQLAAMLVVAVGLAFLFGRAGGGRGGE
jgi:hypothetical protein